MRAFWSIHAGHILLLGAWVLVVAAVYVWTKLRARPAGHRPRLARSPWPAGAALAAIVSGGVHICVIGEHFEESALYGTFFLVLSAVQLGWAVWLLVRPSRAWLLSGAAAFVLVALLWLATRTVGIPLGPEAGELEEFGVLDIIASAAEVAVAVFALVAIRTPSRRLSPVRPAAA
jgi:hypothetical protein